MKIELTHTKVGDYYIPDVTLDEDPATEKFYGKYGDPPHPPPGA